MKSWYKSVFFNQETVWYIIHSFWKVVLSTIMGDLIRNYLKNTVVQNYIWATIILVNRFPRQFWANFLELSYMPFPSHVLTSVIISQNYVEYFKSKTIWHVIKFRIRVMGLQWDAKFTTFNGLTFEIMHIIFIKISNNWRKNQRKTCATYQFWSKCCMYIRLANVHGFPLIMTLSYGIVLTLRACFHW